MIWPFSENENSPAGAAADEPQSDAPLEKGAGTGLPPECERDNLYMPHTEQDRRRAALALLAERLFDRLHGARR